MLYTINETTLSEFIQKNGLNPERNQELSAYNPDRIVIKKVREINGNQAYIFNDKFDSMGVVLIDQNPHSAIYTADEMSYIDIINEKENTIKVRIVSTGEELELWDGGRAYFVGQYITVYRNHGEEKVDALVIEI